LPQVADKHDYSKTAIDQLSLQYKLKLLAIRLLKPLHFTGNSAETCYFVVNNQQLTLAYQSSFIYISSQYNILAKLQNQHSLVEAVAVFSKQLSQPQLSWGCRRDQCHEAS
jgi:hypothetical protein